MEDKIIQIIEEIINPKLLEHDGWIEFEKIVDNKLYIRFRGACSGCGANKATLDDIIKPEILNGVEEIADVLIADYVSEELIDIARSLLGGKK